MFDDFVVGLFKFGHGALQGLYNLQRFSIAIDNY